MGPRRNPTQQAQIPRSARLIFFDSSLAPQLSPRRGARHSLLLPPVSLAPPFAHPAATPAPVPGYGATHPIVVTSAGIRSPHPTATLVLVTGSGGPRPTIVNSTGNRSPIRRRHLRRGPEPPIPPPSPPSRSAATHPAATAMPETRVAHLVA